MNLFPAINRLAKTFAVSLAALMAIGLLSIQVTASTGQTDVDRAEHLLDNRGVPYLKINGIGNQSHPAWTAIYALGYAGEESYDPKLAILKDDKKFKSCINWLEVNLIQQASGLWLWEYGFDNTYNDVSIKAPWSSAFAQAVGIQAFLAAYSRFKDSKYLELASKAAQSLMVPIQDGGLLFQSGNDIWFEEIPQPVDNPSHILNGHMRVLLALKQLAGARNGDAVLIEWINRGTDTLYNWLSRFDTGYSLRYDLNPRTRDLLFRFANPYGYASHSLAIDRIILRDTVSNQEVEIDVGTQHDAEGENRIAGIQWGQAEQLAGRTVRRLLPAALDNVSDSMSAPHSYFYLTLPGRWNTNLREQWFELIVDYYDDASTSIVVQQRSITPGVFFRDMRDGDLHMSTAGRYRRWIIPVRPSDLGYWVGQPYAEKHATYLSQIAQWDERFHNWSKVAQGYSEFAGGSKIKKVEIDQKALVLPKQTPMLHVYSIDSAGVIRQHAPDEASNLNSQFMSDCSGGIGTPVYSPFIVGYQLVGGDSFSGAIENGAPCSILHKEQISRLPALEWLLNKDNYKSVGDAAIYTYPFTNVYNDISSTPPWASAFGQAYVLKSLLFAAEQKIGTTELLKTAIGRAAEAFSISKKDGGIYSSDRSGLPWYEEVPNATHVLNAHLLSIPELTYAARFLKNSTIQTRANEGITALRERLHLFDTGYWLRYDQNPKKEVLLQLDWLEGGSSPLIDEVQLLNPQTNKYVRVDIGVQGDVEGGSRISGIEWQTERNVDGKSVRGFVNGYALHSENVSGGSRHNVFLSLSLPERGFADFFDVPGHRLNIRYKDVAKGSFVVKVQTINDGNQIGFVPLRGGVWQTKGDQQWKDISFIVRPQDLGWYKGPDYQKYEIDQLQRIAHLTNDWYFYQYVERHREYLELHQHGQPVISDGQANKLAPAVNVRVMSSSPTYAGFDFENSLDGDSKNNYTAGHENIPGFVVLKLDRPSDLAAIHLEWENATNVARNVVVSMANPDHSAGKILARVEGIKGSEVMLPLTDALKVNMLRIDFAEYSGQNRILLRQISIVEKKSI